jgi:hypothetical protein
MMKASTWKALESARWDKQSIFKRYFFRPEKQGVHGVLPMIAKN